MKQLLAAVALAFAPVPALADTAPAPPPASPAASAHSDADPALWVVRDEDTTVYLFGTFHLLDTRPWFNDEVKTAFDASDELVLEAIIPENPAELRPIVLRYAVDPQGRRLSDRLTSEENETLDAALTRLGAPAGAFDPLEPWYVNMSLAGVIAQRLGISPENGPEAILSRAARERNLSIGELEGVDWQMRLFDEIPEDQQMAQLRQTLEGLDTAHEVLEPMLAAWSTGNVEGLREIMDAQSTLDPDLHTLLFTNRNRTWAQWIQQRLERPGTVFVAVGAGHLAGEDSVQNVLEARGITAQRVRNADGEASAAAD